MAQKFVPSAADQLRLESLLKAMQDASHLLILTHNDPDPDAIASAIALQYVVEVLTGAETTIAYGGIVGRAENRAMVEYLKLKMDLTSELDWFAFDKVALVDSQPGAGNNALPPDRSADIVFDHHQPFRKRTSLASHADVRLTVGASSTVLTGYVLAAGLEFTPRLATALFYGIRTDTLGLSRDADPLDRAMYAFLQPLVDVDALIAIERAQVPREYFVAFSNALRDAEIYDGETVVVHLEEMYRPDMGAEMADVFVRLENVHWVLCTGFFDGKLMLSLRSTQDEPGAGFVAQDIVRNIGEAGGHGTVGGGQISLSDKDPDELVDKLKERFFDVLDVKVRQGEKLISN